MKTIRVLALAGAASLGLAGCAGIPVGVSVASLYVDTVLFLRTGKSTGDHVVSAIAERDCGFMKVLEQGRLCEDAPPPPLLVAVLRDAKGAPLDGSENPDGGPPRASVEVADAATGTLTDAPPALMPAAPPMAAAPPAEGTRTVVAIPRPETPMVAPAAGEPLPRAPVGTDDRASAGHPGVLVVVGSFTRRDLAEAHRRRLAGIETDIVAGTVDGVPRHRVVIRPTDRADAARCLRLARAGGIADAWLLPWPSDAPGATPAGTRAVAALPTDGAGRM